MPQRPCKIDRILVPVDFSHSSIKAFEYAFALAKQFGAELHLAHVCDYDYVPTLEAVALVIPQPEATRRARRRLRDLGAKQGTELPADHLHVVIGRAYHEICRLAQRIEADLIVISTRGHTGLKHVLLGSTAERVVQHAGLPVMIVREREHDFLCTNKRNERVLRLNKVLVPLDLSDCSMAALQFAVPFAHFWKAGLILFHSVPIPPRIPYGELGVRQIPLADFDAAPAARKALGAIASQMLECGVVVETVVESGPAARQICDYAASHEVDLIITSTHGSTGVVHALLGSTSEHVVCYANCPVLVIPNPKRKK